VPFLIVNSIWEATVVADRAASEALLAEAEGLLELFNDYAERLLNAGFTEESDAVFAATQRLFSDALDRRDASDEPDDPSATEARGGRPRGGH
jgi:hypothetical protein